MKKIILLALFNSILITSSYANNLNYDIGPYKSTVLETKPGNCVECIGKAASFYFNKQSVVVVKDNNDKVFIWQKGDAVINGTLAEDGKSILTENKIYQFKPTEKIPTNLSYYNEKSVKFFAKKQVIVKGDIKKDTLIADSIWPTEYSFNNNLTPVQNPVSVKQLVQNEKINSFEPQLLWSKDNKPVSLQNKPVVAFILNGAQGDDDEAHGGHFAIATGNIDKNGQFNNLLVNNFYGINSFSEKGIISSRVPLDLYQADLNSGQSWYRPSYMLFAVLKNDKLSNLYQQSINHKFSEFYQHHFEYNHALANCSGINVDTLRGLGWNIPKQGVESYIKGIGAIPYVTLTDSFESAKKGSNYMMSEKTDLYPFVAFDAISQDLLGRIAKGQNLTSQFERQFAENLEAIIYVKIPQFPSSRSFGLAPIYSFDEYMKRVPQNKKDWKIVPVEANPFPDSLKDTQVEGFTMQPYVYAILVNVLLILLIVFGIFKIVKKIRNRNKV